MTKKQETYKNIKNSLRKNALAIGAVAVSVPAVAAQPASAQSGGVEAPVAVTQTIPSPSGGTEAPATTTLTEADQALNSQAQQDSSALAQSFLKLGATNPTTKTSLRGSQGELVSTTVTVAAKDAQGHKDGNYTFNVISAEGPDGQPQTNDVYSITASENPKLAKNGKRKPPVASVMIDQNPANNTAEVGATYEVYPSLGAAASSEGNYASISAGLESVSSNTPHLTGPELSATVTQIEGLEKSAKRGDPLHREEPAFDTQGNTINDPAN